eukprot:2479502-Pyramimonas_sp.AAC.1
MILRAQLAFQNRVTTRALVRDHAARDREAKSMSSCLMGSTLPMAGGSMIAIRPSFVTDKFAFVLFGVRVYHVA